MNDLAKLLSDNAEIRRMVNTPGWSILWAWYEEARKAHQSTVEGLAEKMIFSDSPEVRKEWYEARALLRSMGMFVNMPYTIAANAENNGVPLQEAIPTKEESTDGGTDAGAA